MKNTKTVSKKIASLDVSGIRKIFELAKTVQNPIRLDIGIPDFAAPDIIQQKAAEAIANNHNQYSSALGIDPLREKIATNINQQQKTNYSKENIIITSAGTGALSVALAALLDPGDEVIVFDPSFVIYQPLIEQNLAIPVLVSVDEQYNPDISDLEKKINEKTKAIIINSPNNPTGKIYSQEILESIIALAEKCDAYLISDEVYKDFIYSGKKHISPASRYEKTIIADSFSKSYSITGWRVGYLAGPLDVIEQAIKVEQFNYVCPPTPFQHACVDALDIDLTPYLAEYQKRADFVYDSLRDNYKITKPEGAFYFYIPYPYDADAFIRDCMDQSLLVVPGSAFSKNNTHFRIAFTASMDELQKAVTILNNLATKK